MSWCGGEKKGGGFSRKLSFLLLVRAWLTVASLAVAPTLVKLENSTQTHRKCGGFLPVRIKSDSVMRGKNPSEFCFGVFFVFFYVENNPADTIGFMLAHLTDVNLQTSLEETNKNTRCDVREMWFRKIAIKTCQLRGHSVISHFF